MESGSISTSSQSVSPAMLVGSVRRFGPHGVLYEVLKVLDDKRALIRVVETGEEAAYPFEKIFADPTD